MEKLKRAKVGPEGRLTKLDRLHAAMRFMKLHVIVEDKHPLRHKFTLSESMLKGWKNTLSIYEVMDTSVSLAIQKSLSLFVDSGDLLSFSQ